MGFTVILAEKPSVGRDIAKVLGVSGIKNGFLYNDNTIVTWAVGHLVELQTPDEIDERYKRWNMTDLPIIPEQIPLKIIASSKDQFQVVKKLITSDKTERIICATDAGREGQLIFRYIYTLCKCEKPVDRLWISSMTDEAIKQGFRNLQPGTNFDGLYRSAKCRSEADWLIGMNASRAYSIRYDAHLSVGRVQTPTLAILVKRFKEIESFKPQGFSLVTADFGDYKGICFKEQYTPDTHIPTEEQAKSIAESVRKKEAVVVSCETTRGRQLSPQLYDLTSLQRDANRLLGFTAEKTLTIAQSLYEKRKALTYPRTDSRYLPPDMVPKVMQTVKLLPEPYQQFIPGIFKTNGKLNISKRTIDGEKVTDHHAIIPTSQRVKPETFTPEERQLYDLVTRRFIAAFYPQMEYDATKIITSCNTYTFRTTGRVIINPGWTALPPLENPPKLKRKRNEEPENQTLPPLKKGDLRTIVSSIVKTDKAKPPAHYNDATLLAAMESAGKDLDDEELAKVMRGSGIGTPATRADIIEKLIKIGYATRKGKNIIASDKGICLIRVMPQELSSPALTGRWEKRLDEISHGKADSFVFMQDIKQMTARAIAAVRTSPQNIVFPGQDERRAKRTQTFIAKAATLPDVKCPICGQGKIKVGTKSFFCQRISQHCNFTLWRDCLTRGGGPIINEKLAALIFSKNEVHGSTGVIVIGNNMIAFYPTGSCTPTVCQSLIYVPAKNKTY